MREELTESKKWNDQESTSIVDAYRDNVKLIKLPKITKKTWCEWYMRWQSEIFERRMGQAPDHQELSE